MSRWFRRLQPGPPARQGLKVRPDFQERPDQSVPRVRRDLGVPQAQWGRRELQECRDLRVLPDQPEPPALLEQRELPAQPGRQGCPVLPGLSEQPVL